MPFILLCWPTTSKVCIGGVAVEAEPFHQYSIAFCCCVTDGSREAVWQNGIWHGSAYQALVCHWIPLCRNNCIRWCSLTLAEHWWRPNSGCEHSEMMGGEFQQWWPWQWVIYVSAVFLNIQHSGSCSSLAKMPSYWWWLCWKIVFCSWGFTPSNSVIKLSVLVSMEINSKHYVQSDLRMLRLYSHAVDMQLVT